MLHAVQQTHSWGANRQEPQTCSRLTLTFILENFFGSHFALVWLNDDVAFWYQREVGHSTML